MEGSFRGADTDDIAIERKTQSILNEDDSFLSLSLRDRLQHSSLNCPLPYFLNISKPPCDRKGCPQPISLNSAGLLVNEVQRVPRHYKTFRCHNNYKTSRLLLIFVMVLDDVEACPLVCERDQQSIWPGGIPERCAPPTYVESNLWPLLKRLAQLKRFCQLISGPVDTHMNL